MDNTRILRKEITCPHYKTFLVAQTVKNLPAIWETWVGKIPWRREQLPTPVSWLGEFHGQRSLADYSSWGCKESNMTERLSLSFFPYYKHKILGTDIFIEYFLLVVCVTKENNL